MRSNYNDLNSNLVIFIGIPLCIEWLNFPVINSIEAVIILKLMSLIYPRISRMTDWLSAFSYYLHLPIESYPIFFARQGL